VKNAGCTVDEFGNTYVIDPKFLTKLDKPVVEKELVEDEQYEMVDDYGNKADVTYGGIQRLEENSIGFIFKTRLKENLILRKEDLTIRLRNKK
jgi:hypothetical protein